MLLALNIRIAVGEIPPVLPDLRIDDVTRAWLVTIPVLCFSLAAFGGPPLTARLGEERGLLLMCAALGIGIALRPWWGAASLLAGTILCGLAVAVMNVMVPSTLRRRFPARLSEMTSLYTMALTVSAGLGAGFTVPLARALVAFVVWLPQLALPTPSSRAPGADIGLLRDRRAWLITLYFGLQSSVFYILLSWLPTIYRDAGSSPVFAGAVLSFLTISGIVGSLVAPLLAGRLGRPRLAVLLIGSASLVGLIGVLVAPLQLAFAWAALLGTGTAGSLGIVLFLIAAEAKDAAIAARLSGMAQGIGYMMCALGPLAAGLLHSVTSGWMAPLVLAIALCAGQLAAGVAAARPGSIAA